MRRRGISRLRLVLLLVLSALVVLGFALSGSSYRAGKVPALTEFSTPIQDLLRRYPDVANIFPEYGPSDRIGMAFVSEFVAVWGQPDRTEISWWNVWPGNWPFVPQYLWYWKVPAGELQCRIDHPFYELWDKTICNCTIIKNNDGQTRVFVHIVA